MPDQPARKLGDYVHLSRDDRCALDRLAAERVRLSARGCGIMDEGVGLVSLKCGRPGIPDPEALMRLGMFSPRACTSSTRGSTSTRTVNGDGRDG